MARKKDDGQTIAPPADDADTYALNREEPNERRGGGWTVALRRRGKKIVRLFKDSIYGSSDAAYAQARAYRDAIITALPPPTNLEQAVKIRKNDKSGISGVRRRETPCRIEEAEMRRIDVIIAGLLNSIRDAEHVKNTEMISTFFTWTWKRRVVSEGHLLKTLVVSSQANALAQL